MPTVKVVNMAGAQVGEIELSDAVFGRTVNPTVLHAAVRAYLLNQRQGTHSTLTRAEVSGGGKSPGGRRARQSPSRLNPLTPMDAWRCRPWPQAEKLPYGPEQEGQACRPSGRAVGKLASGDLWWLTR